MFSQLEKLSDATCELGKANSLLGLLGDFFEPLEPEPSILLSRYKMYSDMYHVISSIVQNQEKLLSEVSDELYGVIRTLKGGGAA